MKKYIIFLILGGLIYSQYILEYILMIITNTFVLVGINYMQNQHLKIPGEIMVLRELFISMQLKIISFICWENLE